MAKVLAVLAFGILVAGVTSYVVRSWEDEPGRSGVDGTGAEVSEDRSKPDLPEAVSPEAVSPEAVSPEAVLAEQPAEEKSAPGEKLGLAVEETTDEDSASDTTLSDTTLGGPPANTGDRRFHYSRLPDEQ